MADYPLLFKLTHNVRCSKFTARVVSEGRALMAFEDGEWWCHGVEPGGLTEHAPDPPSAFVAFKASYQGILEDLAADSSDFDGFATSVRGFVAQRDDAEAARWGSARAEIRAGKGVEEPFNGLKRIVEDPPSGVTVQLLRQVEAGEEMVALAEAA